MKTSDIPQLKDLLKVLPEKDYHLCLCFMHDRNMLGIKDIVESCIRLKIMYEQSAMRKKKSQDDREDVYKDIDLAGLYILQDKLNDYIDEEF